MGNQSVKEDLPESQAATSLQRRKLERAFEMLLASVGNPDETSYITEEHFKSLFDLSAPLGEMLLRNYHTQNFSDLDPELGDKISKEDFVTFGVKILDLTSAQDQMDFYVETFLLGQKFWNKLDFQTLLIVCMDLEFSKLPNVQSSKVTAILPAMEKSLFTKKETMDRGDFTYWIGRHCPRMLHCLHPYVTTSLCYSKSLEPEGAEAHVEQLDNIVNDHYLMSLSVLWALNTYLPTIYTSAVELQGSSTDLTPTISLADIVGESGWQLLYDSNAQGLSLNRFEHHVMSYTAATLMLVEFDEYLYCVGSDTEYCEKSERWGGSSCFLLQILPQYRVIQAGAGMLYLNIQDRKVPKGFYVGKDSKSTMLNIDCDFNKVQHYGIDLTLKRLEVWGCGSARIYEAQQKQRRWEQADAEKHKNRKLKLDDWKDNPDRQLLELGGVQTEHAER